MNWIGIPAYKCPDITRQTVEDCLGQDIPVNILVIDNSPDDTLLVGLEPLKGESSLYIVQNGYNHGVGPSWNQICDIVFGGVLGEPENQVLICNNDVRLRQDTYRQLLIPKGGLVTAVNVGSMDERFHDPNVLMTPNPIMKGGPDFSCFLVRQEFWRTLGGFPECFMAYREDNLTHWMARFHGLSHEIWSVGVPYVHLASKTIEQNPEIKAQNDQMWQKNGELYERICGGPVGQEKSLDSALAHTHWSKL